MALNSRLSSARITGVDVDPDNVAWCAAHLPFVAARTIPLHPPTSLRAGSFDLIAGISIFTHLSESVQLEWLEELRRLSAPGAILLMSIHGPVATAQRGDLLLWRYVQAHGFTDGRSRDLDDVLFERPSGRRHAITSRGPSGLTISAAGCELEFEAGDAPLIERVLGAESFTLAEARGWAPDVSGEDVEMLLREFVRAGLLDARRQRRESAAL